MNLELKDISTSQKIVQQTGRGDAAHISGDLRLHLGWYKILVVHLR